MDREEEEDAISVGDGEDVFDNFKEGNEGILEAEELEVVRDELKLESITRVDPKGVGGGEGSRYVHVPPGFSGVRFDNPVNGGEYQEVSSMSRRRVTKSKSFSPARSGSKLNGRARSASLGKDINEFSFVNKMSKFLDLGKTLGFTMDGTEGDFQIMMNGMGGKFVDQ
ncbi:hypothetical protein L1987_42327 [Smallanthus sonchifolius]|uniref:Uncharacterized protein n=1 Tax=Smallanthus sonchifolius TaxID=185202 RepID=A0ACB9GJT0_9ASTR|nr:hypothetical protein L1987_42327 [Smallanthus sonchifolius]